MLQLIKINLLKQASFAAFAIFLSSVSQAATFTVTEPADSSGAGSLQQAILDANANPGLDTIEFNIPGTCPQTIKPSPALPDITSPVDIDGYTQPGAAVATANSAATLCIEISGQDLLPGPVGVNGLNLSTGSSGSTIRGLVINRFRRGTVLPPLINGHPINIPAAGSSGGHWIAGNYLNTNAAGTATFLSGGFASVNDGISDGGSGGNIIGHDPAGPNSANPAADRNIISGAGTGIVAGGGRSGIRVFGTSSANQIRGNYIGTDVTGTVDLGNLGRGINLQAANNTIEGNLLSGNDVHGISVADNPGNNLITNNKMGTDVTGTLPLGNFNTGVALATTANNRIEGNVLAFNGAGVGMMSTARSNAILSNSIFGNNRLGIDLVFPPPDPGFGVVNLNDPLDGDVGANNQQNFPVIDVADSFLNPQNVQVRVRLDSKPNQDYLIQGFLSTEADNSSDHGEGEMLVAEKTVTTDASGHVDFRLPVPRNLLPLRSIFTTTATDLITMDTSEFSKWENLDDVEDVKGKPHGL